MEAVERINEVENSRISTPPPHTMITVPAANLALLDVDQVDYTAGVRRTTNSARLTGNRPT